LLNVLQSAGDIYEGKGFKIYEELLKQITKISGKK
jgi:hypothetical protein